MLYVECVEEEFVLVFWVIVGCDIQFVGMVYISLFYGLVMMLIMEDFVQFIDLYLEIEFNMFFINEMVDFVCCEVDVSFCIVDEVIQDVVGRCFVCLFKVVFCI